MHSPALLGCIAPGLMQFHCCRENPETEKQRCKLQGGGHSPGTVHRCATEISWVKDCGKGILCVSRNSPCRSSLRCPWVRNGEMKGNTGGPPSVKFTIRMKENLGHRSRRLPHPWREGAQKEVSFFSILLLLLAAPHGLWDLRSPTRDGTSALCIESAES